MPKKKTKKQKIVNIGAYLKNKDVKKYPETNTQAAREDKFSKCLLQTKSESVDLVEKSKIDLKNKDVIKYPETNTQSDSRR